MTLTTTIGGTASDSYVTLAEYQARATAMGWTLSGTDATDEANLRRAAMVLDGYRWVGYRQHQTQAMAWPRVWVGMVDGWPVLVDTIPARVSNAQMEIAYAIQGGNDPTAALDAVVASSRTKVGPIEEDVTYQGGKASPRFPAVEAMLRPLLQAGGGVGIVRA